ncbi:MAG: hypothetical protein SGI92_16130 [Bryobacteraceae bacterium]|nr:hypothetical protein [Bryobacteraceae bacterium]
MISGERPATYLESSTSSYAAATGNKPTFFGTSDAVFPHFAAGGGEWESVMVIVNLSDRLIPFQQQFRLPDGSPAELTFRSIPDGKMTTATRTDGSLPPRGSINVLLTAPGNEPVKTGWISLDYDTTLGRIGGYLMFRRRFGGSTYEALVPLGAYDDTSFYMPVDNLEGFVTAIAIANPASPATRIRLTLIDLQGATVGSTEIALPGNGQSAFVLADRFPLAAGRVGTILVESSTNRMSAVGIRFNPAGAFSSVPIMNWSGMLR